MAIGIPEQGGSDYLNDAERQILQQESQIVSEHIALQTAQSVEAFSEISPDLIRGSLPQMSEKQRRRVLSALRRIAAYASIVEVELTSPDAVDEAVVAPPVVVRPELTLIGTEPEQGIDDEEPTDVTDMATETQQDVRTDSEEAEAPDSDSVDDESSCKTEVSSEAADEAVDTSEPEVKAEDAADNEKKKTPIQFDPARLENYGHRIRALWARGQYPLSEPITADEAIGLINELYFTPVNYQHAKKDPNRQARLAIRVTASLEGKSHAQVAAEESTQFGLEVKGGAIATYMSQAAPENAVKVLNGLQSGELTGNKVNLDVSRAAVADVPTVGEEKVAIPTTVPDIKEQDIDEELSALEALIQKQFTEYDPVAADLIIDAMQRDKQPRHRKGLDAKDIGDAHGIDAHVVRRIYSQLLRDKQLKGMPEPVKRTREKGQQTAHYLPRVLYVLLPAVALQAEKEHQK